jgi:3D (Asp-Asp-Asp) domain-containing protein
MPKQLMRMYLFYIIVFSFIGFSMFFDVNGDSGSPKSTTTVIGDAKKSTDNIDIINVKMEPNSYYTPKLLKEIEIHIKKYQHEQEKINKKQKALLVQKQKQESNREKQNKAQILSIQSTAYTKNCAGCTGTGKTASGKIAKQGRTISADTSVIPMGCKVKLEFPNKSQYNGTYIVEDRGGAIKGRKIDLYLDSHSDAIDFGRQRNVKATIIDCPN